MTIKELIEQLQQYPEDQFVYCYPEPNDEDATCYVGEVVPYVDGVLLVEIASTFGIKT